jgi:hypothetical protein
MNIKNIISVASISMLIAAIFFISCKKENNTPPIITISGTNPDTVILGSIFIPPTVTAVDNSGNSLTSQIVTDYSIYNPDTAQAGTYTITYLVSDANGNTTSATKTVYVVVTPANFTGYWSVTDLVDTTTITYIDLLYTSATPKNVYVTRFADYSDASIFFTLSGKYGTTVTLPQQSIICGDAGVNQVLRSFKGTGTIAANGSTITINYGVVAVGATDTTKGTETYVARIKK